jgi:hypothetical protein
LYLSGRFELVFWAQIAPKLSATGIGSRKRGARKGLRVLPVTHHNDSLLAHGNIEPVHSGLTPFGRYGISEMSRVGIFMMLRFSLTQNRAAKISHFI